MKKYEAYKDSGIEWLRDIPDNWVLKRLKYIKANKTNAFVDGPFGSNLKSEHYIDNGEVYVIESGFITSGKFEQHKKFKTISFEHFKTIERSACEEGDVIIAKIGANYGTSGILPSLDKFAVVSGNSLKFSLNTIDNDLHFFHLFLLFLKSSGTLDLIVNATAQPALSLSTLNNVPIPIPTLSEQTQIAKYLDYQTGLIDAVVEKKELLIKKLKEQRQAIINEAVTKGLNPNAKMKDSGIEWLGDIPEGWMKRDLQTVVLNNQYSLTGGPFGSDLKHEEYTEEGVQIIQLNNIGVGVFKNDNRIYTSEEKADELHSCNIFPGDIIIAKMAEPVARACVMPDLADRYLMASDGIRLEVNKDKFNTKFLEYAINSNYFNLQAELNSTGTTRLRIGLTTLRKLKLVTPDIAEQNQIVDYLENYNNNFQLIITKTKTQVDRLKSYRQSIISEAVTGKIDVREWKAKS